MGKYTAKPIVIEAVQFTLETWDEVKEFVGAYGLPGPQLYMNSEGMNSLLIPCGDVYLIAIEGDWVCRNKEGAVQVFNDEEFNSFWEPAKPIHRYMEGGYAPKLYICVICGEKRTLVGAAPVEPDRVMCVRCGHRLNGNRFTMLPFDSPAFAMKEAYKNAARRVR